MSLKFCCTFLHECSCLDGTFGQLFTLRPLILCFSPTHYAKSLLKSTFFRMFMGNYWERNRESEVLNTHSNIHFPRKVPIFRAGKNAKFALQHPIIFGVLASPWTILKTEKIEFAFSWEMKSFNQLLLIQPTTNAKWSLIRRDNNSSNDTKRCWWYTILLMVRQIWW